MGCFNPTYPCVRQSRLTRPAKQRSDSASDFYLLVDVLMKQPLAHYCNVCRPPQKKYYQHKTQNLEHINSRFVLMCNMICTCMRDGCIICTKSFLCMPPFQPEQVQHIMSPRRGNHAAAAAAGSPDGDGDNRMGFNKSVASNWSGVVQGARNGLARFASPLASSRWQVWPIIGLAKLARSLKQIQYVSDIIDRSTASFSLMLPVFCTILWHTHTHTPTPLLDTHTYTFIQVKRTAVRGCVMVLSGLQKESGSSSQPAAGDERVRCLDVNKARKIVTRAVRSVHPVLLILSFVCT